MAILFAGCSKQEIDCKELKEGLLLFDNDAVNQFLNPYLSGLSPTPTDEDPIGHETNFIQLVDYLNECPELSLELRCYACIYTLPPQTEIKVTIDDNTVIILDFRTPEGGSISFAGMHN